MGFAYSCFISYSHGQHDLMQAFVNDLKRALASSLEPYFRQPVYLDDRLQPGWRYNEALAQAICQSVAMIVVFTPRWAQSDYCQREFRGMLSLERMRREMAGDAMDPAHGLIIPVLFRGSLKDIPQEISNHRHYCDFTQFTTAGRPIGRHPESVQKIETIARYVYDMSQTLGPFSQEACADCQTYELPLAADVPDLIVAQPPFPGRAA